MSNFETGVLALLGLLCIFAIMIMLGMGRLARDLNDSITAVHQLLVKELDAAKEDSVVQILIFWKANEPFNPLHARECLIKNVDEDEHVEYLRSGYRIFQAGFRIYRDGTFDTVVFLLPSPNRPS